MTKPPMLLTHGKTSGGMMEELTELVIEQLADGVPFYNLLSGYDSESLIQELAHRLRDANEEIDQLIESGEPE